MFLSFSVLATIFSGNVLSLLNLGEEYAVILPSFIKKMFFLKLVENANLMLYSFLILQKIIRPMLYTNLTALFIFTLSCYFSLQVFNLGLNGYILSFGLKQLSEVTMNLFVIYKYNHIKFHFPSFLTVLKTVPKNISMCFYNSIGIYGAIFAFEINTYLAATFNNVVYIITW